MTNGSGAVLNGARSSFYDYVANNPINAWDPLGLCDVYVNRDYADRNSPADILVKEGDKVLYRGRANENPFFAGTQGIRAGTYNLFQKGESWGPGRYPSEQPAITGTADGLKPGQANSTYRNPFFSG